VNQLKESDPEDRLGSGAQEHVLIVHCLVEIYDQGGGGAELTRQRIELESRKATGQAKKFLLRALEHPRLKPRSLPKG
jgi:hypothetical protein